MPPVELFISYSREDSASMEALVKHLSPLKRQGLIQIWADQLSLKPGNEWEDVLLQALDRAPIILVLVSAEFFHSEYGYQRELPRALARAERGEALLLPVLVKSVDWKGEAIARFQALPEHGRPVSDWPDQDKAWMSVARKVREVAEELLKQRSGTEKPVPGPLLEPQSDPLGQPLIPDSRPTGALSIEELLRLLSRLLPSQFEAVILLSRAPAADLSSNQAPQASRAVQLITWAEQHPSHGARLMAALEKVVPKLLAHSG